MMATLKGLADLKVKDVPEHLKKVVTSENVKRSTWSFVQNYNRQYIKTSSIRPLHDVFIVIGLFAYAVNWPNEVRHLRAREDHERSRRRGQDS